MYRMFQIAGRFSPAGVGTWMGQHKIDPGHLFVSEEAAMKDACERMIGLAKIAGVRLDPEPTAHRNASGSLTIRCPPLDAIFVIKEYCKYK